MVQIAARASPARVLASDRSRYETAAKAERPPQVGSGGYTPVRGRERDKAGAVSAETAAGVASRCRVWPPEGIGSSPRRPGPPYAASRQHLPGL